MKRFMLWLLMLVAVPALTQAQALSGSSSKFVYGLAAMRNTSAASVAVETNWAEGGAFQPATGFVDSSVFRRGGTSQTAYDTTAAYHISQFPFPPDVQYQGGIGDTADVAWLKIRVEQDTISYAFVGTSTMYSIKVGAEISSDGNNWIGVDGTNTRAFSAVYFTSGQDGTQAPALLAGEPNAAADAAEVLLFCVPGLELVSSLTPILMRTLCQAGDVWVRFLIGMDGSGQYRVKIGQWTAQ